MGQGLKLYELIKEEDEKEISAFTEKRMKQNDNRDQEDDIDAVDNEEEIQRVKPKIRKGFRT